MRDGSGHAVLVQPEICARHAGTGSRRPLLLPKLLEHTRCAGATENREQGACLSAAQGYIGSGVLELDLFEIHAPSPNTRNAPAQGIVMPGMGDCIYACRTGSPINISPAT